MLALLVLTIFGVRFASFNVHYPYIVVNGPTGIRFAILQHPVSDAATCNAIGENIANAVLTRCAECEISRQSCVPQPPSELDQILSEAPINVPSARLNNGAIAFFHTDPSIALHVCQEGEKQTATHSKTKFVCEPALKPRPFPVGHSVPSSSWDNAFTFVKWLMILLLPSIAILTTIQFLAVRSPMEAPTHSSPAETDFKFSNFAKRLLDVFGALLLIFVLTPVFLVVAALVFIFEGTPIFYISRRYITAEDAVTILKFRTMVRDASTSKYRLRERFMRDGYLDIPLNCEVYTPIGRILERTQLVEILQLFNILLHGMSFVGNRPLPKGNVDLLKKFEGWEQRFESPAGITGVAQIVGKYSLEPQQRLLLERMYSSVYTNNGANILLCDAHIILHTIFLLVSGRYLEYDQAIKMLVRHGAKNLPVNDPQPRTDRE